MAQWNVGGVILPHGPYIIGAGVCKNPDATAKWLQVAPVVSGSYTEQPREGNEGRVFYPDTLEEFLSRGCGVNSFGMPNMGFQAAAKELALIKAGQPLIVSVAGFSVDEYVTGVATFQCLPTVAAIELNFGCPNTQGEHSEIMSFNPTDVEAVLQGIVEQGVSKPIWAKFSPYTNPNDLNRMAKVMNNFKNLLSLTVVTCNTVPDTYIGPGKIDPNNGLGGLSGPAIKHLALGQVRRFRQHLNPTIGIIGVGGMVTGNDVMDFLDAGANAVQMTSLPFWSGNPNAFFDQLLREETADRLLKYLSSET